MTQENATPSGSPTVITQILVPTDLSAFSEQVLDYALELAKALGARIRLFHAAVQPDYEVPFLVSPECAARRRLWSKKRRKSRPTSVPS
jgi:nucleotide-binding universal stress UspA family protein